MNTATILHASNVNVHVGSIGPVSVLTTWHPQNCWHETAISWGDDVGNTAVVATEPGTVSATRAHIQWSDCGRLARFILNKGVSYVDVS